MKFPKMIRDFMLHDVVGNWTYKGQELRSAHYIRVGSRMGFYISTVADVSGKQKFEIQFRDSYISGIASLEKAVAIADEVIVENKLFIEKESIGSSE